MDQLILNAIKLVKYVNKQKPKTKTITHIKPSALGTDRDILKTKIDGMIIKGLIEQRFSILNENSADPSTSDTIETGVDIIYQQVSNSPYNTETPLTRLTA